MIHLDFFRRNAVRLAALSVCLLTPVQRTLAAPLQQTPPDKAQIWVRFVDESGEPVAGVELKQQVQGRRHTIATSTVDGLAVAELDWIWPLEGRAWSGFAEHFGHALMPLQAKLTKGREFDLGEVKLAPGGAVSGRVFGADGRPLLDANVRVVPTDADDEPLARYQTIDFTKSDGSYRVVGITPGSYRVWAKHDTTRWAKVENVHVEAGKENTGVDVKVEFLPDEYRIDGTVLDPEGRPVAGADVRTAVPDTDGTGSLLSRTVSDAKGKFSLFLSVQPEEQFWIEVHDPAERWSDLMHGDAVPGDRDVVLKFTPALELGLTVLDSTGAPVEEFGWALRIERGTRSKLEETLPARHPGGVVKIRAPSAPFRVEVRSPLHESKSIGPLNPAALPATTELRLDRLPWITGRVTHAGQPLEGAHVALVRPGTNPMVSADPEFITNPYQVVGDASARTDAQGRFAIAAKQRVAEGRVLASSRVASEAVSGPVQAGAAEITIDLAAGGSVEGSVLLPAGVDPANAVIELYRDAKRIRRTVDASRKWRCEHLAPGPWLASIVYLPPPAAARTATVGLVGASKQPPYLLEVKEGATTKRDLDFSRDAACRVSGALTVAGKAPGKAIVTLFSRTTPALEISSCSVDDDGRLTLAAREPGEYRIAWRGEASKFSKNFVIDRITLAPGDNAWSPELTEAQWQVRGIDLSKNKK